MKTMDIPTSTVTVDSSEMLRALEQPAARDTGKAVTRTFDGCRWTYRNGFDAVLGRISAASWADPAQLGAVCVKKNAARTVWRVELDRRAYFLKYYFTRRWLDVVKEWVRSPACAAEWRGGLYALRAGIATVPPAGFTTQLNADGRRCALLVTEAVEPASALNEFWATLQTDSDRARRRADTACLLEELASLIARAHQAGFQHTDMHAENILVQRTGPRAYRVVFVDLHSARLGVPISDLAVVQNLAQLNQWFRRHATIGDRLRFLRAYTRWRNEYEYALPHARHMELSFRELVRALADAADQHAWQLWAQRDRRARRNGRYFGRTRVGGGWRAQAYLRCKRPGPESRASQAVLTRDWWRRQLRDPLRWFSDAASESCKDSHSAQVRRAVLEIDDERRLPVIIKRPLARNFWRQLRMLWTHSRARRGWRMGNALLHRNLDTARPLAMVERRLGPLVLDNILVTEAVPGARDLETYVRDEAARRGPSEWHRHKLVLIEALARLMRRFEERGFVHRDCKAGNILVAPQPSLRVLWIDMDGIRLVRRPSAVARVRALARLHVSLTQLPGLTRADRARFLRSYCARFGSGVTCWRDLWRQIDAFARYKEQARERRRQWKLKHYGRE